MKVRATRLGYYGHRRRPEGSVFIIKDKPLKKDGKTPMELGSWMEPVLDPAVPVKDTKMGEVTLNANDREAEASAEKGGDDVI